MSSHGVGAVAGCNSDNNHVAKKRRRWSTAQQEAVLGSNRFGVKKQLKILGRHHVSSTSVNSLASFQSKSNPIFEPSEEPSYSCNNSKLEAEETRSESKWNAAILMASLDGLSRGGAGVAESHQQPHPKSRSRLGKTGLESCLLSNPTGAGDWALDEKEDDAMENPIMLPSSPAITGKRAFHGMLGESRAITPDYGEGQWPIVDEEGPDETGALALSSVLRSSDDGAQSIEGPPCLTDDGSQKEMLSSLEACKRRSRELVEQVQANAAADLSQMRSYKALIEQLRVESAKHEAAAKEWSDLHRDAMAQLVSARGEISELERQRGLQDIAVEEFKQKQGIEKDLQDAMVVSDKLKLETMEREQDGCRKQVEALEMELMAAKSELSAIAVRKERMDATAAAEHDVATPDDKIKGKKEAQVGADSRGEIETGFHKTTLESAAGTALSAQKLCEVQAQLTAVCKQMEKLRKERDELRIYVEDAERRVTEAEKERDSVVLAVQQEWDSVKVALRQDKEKLERELQAAWEQNTKLQNELDTKNKILEAGNRYQTRNLEAGGEESLQVYIGDKIIQSGTERGDSLIALWHDYQKLEVELSEAFDHNKQQRSDREALNVALVGVREGNKKLEGEREALTAALIGVRDGNKKLEGDLNDLQLEKTKLERERDDLMIAVREERQKLENERAVVCKAMRGENEKLESDREVLLAMQEYLKKLEMKQDKAQPVDKAETMGGDEKRRRKGKRGAP